MVDDERIIRWFILLLVALSLNGLGVYFMVDAAREENKLHEISIDSKEKHWRGRCD